MNRLCIDLCSGLGGFSQAFVDAGWEVRRFDFDPKFRDVPFTSIEDICELLETPGRSFWDLKPFVILCSPPCERLSKADDWPLPGVYQGMRVAGACLEIIARMRPKYWALENPRWSYIRWFIGEPTKRLRLNSFGYRTVKPTGIWGNTIFPFGLVKDSPKKNDPALGPDAFARGPRRSADRAKMPYGLSQAILAAVAPEHGEDA